MTNAVVFHNDGLVPIEAFTTFGMSAKPSTNNPIGFFGTGLKYAVACTVRLGGKMTVWIGEKQYEFYAKTIDFRGTEFKQIAMRRRNGFLGRWSYHTLPFTTQLGKTWEPWQVIRELESNTRDENGHSHVSRVVDIGYLAKKDRTVIMVEGEVLLNAYENLDDIFRPDTTLIYEDDTLRCYEGESKHIFYRGLRVHTPSKPSKFTYDLKQVDLTEDRTLKYWFWEMNKIRDSLLACSDERVVKALLEMREGFELSLDFDQAEAKQSKKTAALFAAIASSRAYGSPVPSRLGAWFDNQLPKKRSPDDEVQVTARIKDWQEILELADAHGKVTVANAIRRAIGEEVAPPVEFGDGLPF